jgi:uncharacterized protein (TIRG00374 family)
MTDPEGEAAAPGNTPSRPKGRKRAVAIFISLLVLFLLYWKVDRHALVQNLLHMNWRWFSLALFMFIPQIIAISWRWKRMAGALTPVSIKQSVTLVLASQTLNLVLPSKMGDLSKGYFLARSGAVDLATGMSVVIFEKMLDVAALAAWMIAGIFMLMITGFSHHAIPMMLPAIAAPFGIAALGAVLVIYAVPLRRFLPFIKWCEKRFGQARFFKVHKMVLAGHRTLHLLRAKGGARSEILLMSILIWFLHLVQIWFFFQSLGAHTTVVAFVSMVPLAIFIGLIPVSLAGFGTRDAAFVALFPQVAAPTMLAAALYVNLRYLIPAVAGIPFLNRAAIQKKAAPASHT